MCFKAAGMHCNLSLPDLILLGRGGKRSRDVWVCSHCCFTSDAQLRAVIFGEFGARVYCGGSSSSGDLRCVNLNKDDI